MLSSRKYLTCQLLNLQENTAKQTLFVIVGFFDHYLQIKFLTQISHVKDLSHINHLLHKHLLCILPL